MGNVGKKAKSEKYKTKKDGESPIKEPGKHTKWNNLRKRIWIFTNISKTKNQKHFNEVDENRQKCSKPYRKTADKIRAWCHVFYTLIASSVLYTHSGISRFFRLLRHDLRFKKWKFCHNPLLKILNRIKELEETIVWSSRVLFDFCR